MADKIHTGTDCQHTGNNVQRPHQGICFKCARPLAVRPMPGNKPFEGLAILILADGKLVSPFPKFTIFSKFHFPKFRMSQ